MSVERVQTKNPDQLVYRAGGHWLFAAIATLIGFALLGGTATRLVLDWPQDAWEYAGGLLFCLACTIWAVGQFEIREVLLDRQAGRAFVTTRWFGIRKHKSFDITDAIEVRLQKIGGWVPDSYVISLGKPDGPAPVMDEVFPAEDPEKIATEIAQHLKLPLGHYVYDVKIDDATQGRAGKGKETEDGPTGADFAR
jgi:hypothetical protein